jgi:hypothetical protein
MLLSTAFHSRHSGAPSAPQLAMQSPRASAVMHQRYAPASSARGQGSLVRAGGMYRSPRGTTYQAQGSRQLSTIVRDSLTTASGCSHVLTLTHRLVQPRTRHSGSLHSLEKVETSHICNRHYMVPRPQTDITGHKTKRPHDHGITRVQTPNIPLLKGFSL